MLRLVLPTVLLLVLLLVSSSAETPAVSPQQETPSVSSSWASVNVWELESKPGAEYTIYLDFDGDTTTDTRWNRVHNNGQAIVTPPFSIDGTANVHSQTNLTAIGDIWARVAEDYAPFNVNVTTIAPPVESDGSIKNGMRVCIGGNSKTWYKNNSDPDDIAGGVAYPNTFGSEDPVFIFPNNLSSNPKIIADAVSHEVGHTVGLMHHGLGLGGGDRDSGNDEYYWGDKGKDWAPIMGAGYEKQVTQWSDGQYTNASRPSQGDLEILSGNLGGYRDDVDGLDGKNDYTDGIVDIEKEAIVEITEFLDPHSGENVFFATGMIETNTDFDMFQFTLDAGQDFTFEVLSGYWDVNDMGFMTDPNLDILAKLFFGESEIDLLAALGLGAPDDYMGILPITLSDLVDELLAGTYYLWLQGTGREGHYSDYGSVGTYAVSGRIIEQELPNSNPPVSPEPTTLIMMGLGLAGLVVTTKRRRE